MTVRVAMGLLIDEARRVLLGLRPARVVLLASEPRVGGQGVYHLSVFAVPEWLEQIARYRNRTICSSFLFSHRFCGKPASTFPRDALGRG